jgi:hypothetical protein
VHGAAAQDARLLGLCGLARELLVRVGDLGVEDVERALAQRLQRERLAPHRDLGVLAGAQVRGEQHQLVAKLLRGAGDPGR